MKKRIKLIVLVFSFAGAIPLSYGQQTETALDDFRPSSLNQPGKEFPKVKSQGYARFKIEAPTADSVRVSLGLAEGAAPN